jgi:hypothetical protein
MFVAAAPAERGVRLANQTIVRQNRKSRKEFSIKVSQFAFSGGVPVMYEFSISSLSAVITNLTKSTDGTINISAVFTLEPYGGI